MKNYKYVRTLLFGASISLTAPTIAASAASATVQTPDTEADTESQETTDSSEMITTTSVNIRNAPKDGAVIKTVPAGTKIKVESAYSGWAKIADDGGYICAKYLTDKNVPKGIAFKLPKKTKPGSSFEDKEKALKKEAKKAEWHYSGKGLFIYTNRFTEDSGKTFLLTRVLVKDPAVQMGQDFSYGDFGGTRELPTDAGERLGAALITNGSYFSYETGQPACASVFINKGQVISGSSANGKEVCLLSDGNLFTPEAGTSAQELVDKGVIATWGTADPLLIQNSQRVSTSAQINGGTYPRTAIGCVEPGEYYIITAGTAAYTGGLSFQDLQDLFTDLGCNYARSLDGGGSSSLVFNGKLLNTPAAGEQRPVVDFLYFTEEK